MGTSNQETPDTQLEVVPESVVRDGDGLGEYRAPEEFRAEERLASEPWTGLEGADLAPDEDLVAGDERAFGVVGVGASAGGLDSITRLFEALPADTGLAFVIVQHLDRNHESLMVELLSRITSMPVVQAFHNVLVEPDHVYVMPPGVTMVMSTGRLTLEARPTRGQNMPIDLFLRSLAIERRSRAVGVILSGTGTDGALALQAIKGEGGIVFAESEASAQHTAMPRSAASTGHVDFVLPAGAIGQEIAALASQLRGAYTRAELEAGVGGSREMRRILAMLRSAKGVDFSLYRPTTIRRRIIRRMLLHKLSTVGEYVHLLREQPGEIQELYSDVLIRVTAFFRDPAVHQALRDQVFPALLRDRRQDEPVRIWVPGCATGEEAYSLAIGLVECMAELKASFPVQIFATDVSDVALERARAGIYIENIALDVSPERLRRFFSRSGTSYQISKSIREMCVFARQDMTSDPPFSRLDLISCRNVLIYIEPPMQRRVLNIFHYALKPAGFLVLGQAETTSSAGELFKIVDRQHRIFAPSAVTSRGMLDLAPAVHPAVHACASGATSRSPSARPPEEPAAQVVQREADRVVMARYAPPGVVVNDDMHVLQFRGQTGQYLEPAPGEPSFNLLKMARPPLAMELRTAVHKAQKSGEPVRSGPIEVRVHGSAHTVVLNVLPLRGAAREELTAPGASHFVILFEEQRPEATPAPSPRRGRKTSAAAPPPAPADRREEARLEQELAATRDHMQSAIEELEAVNEELQSANEEILSSNEELQSINEELETAKEELQSTNEELTTLNEELRTRNLELTQLNNDLNNLLSSVSLPIVMLGTDLRVRRFTPLAERVLNLIPTDVGRRIGDIRPQIRIDDLEERIAEVIDTMKTFEREVCDREGSWYSLRIRPYRTADHKIEGAVLALFDISESRQALEELREMNEYADALLEIVSQPLLVLDGALRVRKANQAFLQHFRVAPEDTRGRFLYELGNGQWNIHSLRVLLEEILPNKVALRDYVVEHDFPEIGPQRMRLNARLLPRPGGESPECILLAFEQIGDAWASARRALDPGLDR